MTESSTVVCSTSEDDICQGTSGSLIPGVRAKVIDQDGREITEYNKPGELLIQSPSVTLGVSTQPKGVFSLFFLFLLAGEVSEECFSFRDTKK
jgi:acyl-CoA synthetase (AMP-forming)/AMP-acid ligase II